MSAETQVEYVIWKQRDGTPIRVVDMDDNHLFNTIRMLERNAEAKCERAIRGDTSMDPDEVPFDYEAKQFLKPIHAVMTAVAISRGIKL